MAMFKTNNEQGRTVCVAITAYMVAKAVINMFFGGFSFGGLVGMFVSIGFALLIGVLMFTGLEYVNYGVAGYLALGFLAHLPGNILHITDNWIYLLEGLVDVGCAVVLLILPAVKEHFTNPWNEFLDNLRK